MSTALITGCNGKDVHYFVGFLRSAGLEVIGISRPGPWLRGSVMDRKFVEKVIAEHRPAYVIHLGTTSTTRHADTIDADTPIQAESIHAAARIYTTCLARYYRQQFGIRTYVGYFFHHDSPRRPLHHLALYVADSALRARAGTFDELRIGDLSLLKEWNYAGDLVQAAWCLMNQGTITEAVLGSGEEHSVQEWVESCFTLTGRNWRHFYRDIPGFKSDHGRILSRPSRLLALGWKPSVDFTGLARIMLKMQPEPEDFRRASDS
jgi:GDPmannose 4,6-dehydratase